MKTREVADPPQLEPAERGEERAGLGRLQDREPDGEELVAIGDRGVAY